MSVKLKKSIFQIKSESKYVPVDIEKLRDIHSGILSINLKK